MSELAEANLRTKWSSSLYHLKGWQSDGKSVQGRPLIYYVCGDEHKNTTLIFSTVHGDEITPVYFGLRLVSWLQGEKDICKNQRVVVAPLVNPDGFMRVNPTRTNARGVDLNRNLATKDFETSAYEKWKTIGKGDKRRYPGPRPASEPETLFQQRLIDRFHPTKILSVHSPLNFFDYDGPESEDLRQFTKEYIESCNKLRKVVKQASPAYYKFLQYGFFPGSLGNYAGRERGIPTLTLELPTTDHTKAKSYFEGLKNGLYKLIVHQLEPKKSEQAANHQDSH
jgi:protein MpaA